MTKLDLHNLHVAIRRYKNICMSIDLYSEILSIPDIIHILDLVTHPTTIQTGLYTIIYGCNIYVSHLCSGNDIMVSDNMDVDSLSNKNWSSCIPLSQFHRFDKLNCFW